MEIAVKVRNDLRLLTIKRHDVCRDSKPNFNHFSIILFQLIPVRHTGDFKCHRALWCGWSAVTGTLVGDAVWMIGAAIGLAAVMQANPDGIHGFAIFWCGVFVVVGLGTVACGAQ